MRSALATLAAVLALVAWRYAPPPARGADAPATEFSAARATAALARVVGDGAPHPTGSAANAAVRARLVAELEGLGLRPAVEERLACGWARCATVANVLATVAGSDPARPAVLLASHYDSVASGPGGADDGVGVATTIEVARALLAGPRPARDVLLLVDDGEEQGLLGAEAFALDAARRRRIAAVVNVEARGTTGPSLLFELSAGSARLVGEAARSLPRPVTNSIYYTIYKRLPNDTDLTVFKREGMAGVNFAFVGAPLRYHTPRDDLRHLDAGSLQHHGDHALGMVRALAASRGSFEPAGDAVFFDVLAAFVVRWPQPWTLPLAVFGAALVVAAVVRERRRVDGARGGAGWGAAAALGSVVLTVGLGWALLSLLRALGAIPYQWVASAWPLRLGFWMVPVVGVALCAGLLGERLGAAGAWSATWIGWALLAVVAAAMAPGVSYPFVVPVLVAGVAGLAARPGSVVASLAPLVGAALLFFPVGWMLYEGMGAPALPGISIVVALVLTGTLPGFAGAPRRWRVLVAVVALVAVVVGAVAARVLPPFTADQPQPLSLVLYNGARETGDAPATRWVAGSADLPLPPSVASAGGFTRASSAPYPWASQLAVWVASEQRAPQWDPAPPRLDLAAVKRTADGLHARGLLRSTRGASIAGLYVPGARLRSVRLAGQELVLRPVGERDEWQIVEHVTLPAEGADVELTFVGVEPLTVHVFDVQLGLGGEGAALLGARPDWAVPISRGDRSVVSRPVVLAATR
jgi:hypothetical protein